MVGIRECGSMEIKKLERLCKNKSSRRVSEETNLETTTVKTSGGGGGGEGRVTFLVVKKRLCFKQNVMLGDRRVTNFVLLGAIFDQEILNNGAEVHGNKLTVQLHSQDAITNATALTEGPMSYVCYGGDKT